MIPASLASIAIFVALLAPGFVYLQRRESNSPGVDYTALRETSLVITISLLSLALSAAAASVVMAVTPLGAPDVGPFVRGGATYAKDHYREVVLWSFVIVTGACVIANWLAIPSRLLVTFSRRLARSAPNRHGIARFASAADRRRSARRVEPVSGWGKLFTVYPDADVYVDVTLTNGTWVSGLVYSYSAQIQETADRDLLLSHPLLVKGADEAHPRELEAQAMCIRASEIALFAVRYVTPAR